MTYSIGRWRAGLTVALLGAVAACGPSATNGDPTAAVASVSSSAAVSARPAAAQVALASADQSVAFGSPATVAFTLTAAGSPIASAPVNVQIGAKQMAATTDVSGKASIDVAAADLVPGKQQAMISFAGDSRYQAASASGTVTVNPAATTVQLVLAAQPSGSTAATASVGTASGVEAGGSVDFFVDGTAAGSQPVSAGQASAQIAAGLGSGDHQVIANFVPADPTRFGAASAGAALSITKSASTLTATGSADVVRYGDHATMTVRVAGPPSADLVAGVTLLDGSTTLAEGTTDETGLASLVYLNTADPGSKTYTVDFAGNDVVGPSQTQVTVQSAMTNVDIGIDKPTLKPGDSGSLTVTVHGTPAAPSGIAMITVDGVQIAAGPLDSAGSISAPLSSVTAGDHAVAVDYAGDVRFQPATASATLTVQEPLANPNAAGAAALAGGNPCPPSAAACVDLSNTQAWLQTGGQIPYGPVPITSGMEGHRTGTGTFTVYWRDRDHLSSLFNDAPMPNSVFFDGGIAFHEGSLTAQSHGCIHLSWDASETFFDTLAVGDQVYVFGEPPY